MDAGLLSGQKPEALPAESVPTALNEFVKWLSADGRALEIWGLLGARLARVECTAAETQTLELDSGDWVLVRLSGLRTTPALPTSLSGIVRFRRVVGKAAEPGAEPSGANMETNAPQTE